MKIRTEHLREQGANAQRRAVLYARVSSKDQEKEGFSIPAQQKLLREYAALQGLTVVREYVDVETAKETGRIGFTAMVEFLKKAAIVTKPGTEPCRVILVEKTDRLYRNIKDWVTLDELDIEVHFVKENQILSYDSHSSAKFLHGIKVLMAKNYIDNLREEVKKGMREKAEQGLWPTVAPLGYRNVVRLDGKKIIEPHPEHAPIIARLFEWYATGQYTLHDLTEIARNEGLYYRKTDSLIPTSTIHTILCNRIYTGEFEWDGQRYQGTHPPLVTHELWEQVQTRLRYRSMKKHRKMYHDFAFSRLIDCGHCGCSLVGEIKKGRYIYYHCTGYKGKCPESYTREEVLEAQFTDLLRQIVLDEEVVTWAAEALRHQDQQDDQRRQEAVERLRAEYDRLQNRLDAMYLDKLDGRISNSFFDEKAEAWRTEQRQILQAMEAHRGASRLYVDEGLYLLELARRAPALFQQQPLPEKHRLLNVVLSNCTWKEGRLSATFRQPFDLLADTATAWATKKAAGAASTDLHLLQYAREDSNL